MKQPLTGDPRHHHFAVPVPASQSAAALKLVTGRANAFIAAMEADGNQPSLADRTKCVRELAPEVLLAYLLSLPHAYRTLSGARTKANLAFIQFKRRFLGGAR